MKLRQSRNMASRTTGPTFRQALLWPGALVMILVVLAACSSSASENPAGSTGQGDSLAKLNPCELLTPVEVESIFGEAATADSEPTLAGPVSSCTFKNDSGGKFFLIQLGPESALEVDAGDPDVTVITGLGDEATFSNGTLRVRVGETVLQVPTWHPQSRQDEALAMTQEIARIALERLP